MLKIALMLIFIVWPLQACLSAELDKAPGWFEVEAQPPPQPASESKPATPRKSPSITKTIVKHVIVVKKVVIVKHVKHIRHRALHRHRRHCFLFFCS